MPRFVGVVGRGVSGVVLYGVARWIPPPGLVPVLAAGACPRIAISGCYHPRFSRMG